MLWFDLPHICNIHQRLVLKHMIVLLIHELILEAPSAKGKLSQCDLTCHVVWGDDLNEERMFAIT